MELVNFLRSVMRERPMANGCGRQRRNNDLGEKTCLGGRSLGGRSFESRWTWVTGKVGFACKSRGLGGRMRMGREGARRATGGGTSRMLASEFLYHAVIANKTPSSSLQDNAGYGVMGTPGARDLRRRLVAEIRKYENYIQWRILGGQKHQCREE